MKRLKVAATSSMLVLFGLVLAPFAPRGFVRAGQRAPQGLLPTRLRPHARPKQYLARPSGAQGEDMLASGGQQDFYYIAQFGSDVAGPGDLNAPDGIAIDRAGNVYVADTDNDRVQKFDSNGEFITQFGGTGAGPGQFLSPETIAVDSKGNIYVGDR